MSTTLTRPPRRAAATAVLDGRRRRLDATDVARGVTSAATLLALLVGIPWFLTVVGWPLVPAWLQGAADAGDVLDRLFTTPDDGTLLLGVLTAVAWFAWASFAAAVAVEVVALRRGRPPLRLRWIAPQQRAAGGLVASLVVLVSGPLAVAAPPTPPVAASSAPLTTPSAPDLGEGVRLVLVQRGDTLWGIAEAELGDGAAYGEIAVESRSLIQPDGRTLQDPDRIYPGWQVALPGADQGADGASAPTAPNAPAGQPTTAPSPTVGGGSTSQATGLATTEQATSPSTPSAQTTSSASTSQLVPSSSSGGQTITEAASGASPFDEHTIGVVAWGGLSAMTAAGLIGLLRIRRSRQQRRRRAGHRLPAPPADVHDSERRLAASQDPLTVARLDGALRLMARRCAEQRSALPDLQLVRLLPDHIELHLATPMTPLSPFTTLGGEDTVWSAPRTALTGAAPLTWEEQAAPYPVLVAIGSDLDGAQILLDLEHAGGLTVRERGAEAAVDAAGPTGESVLAALTVELGTTAWGEDLDVTCLGTDSDLVDVVDVGRLRHTDDVPRLLSELGSWAEAVSTALRGVVAADLHSARCHASMVELLRPRVLVIGQVEQTTLLTLVDGAAKLRAATPILPLVLVSAPRATDSATAVDAAAAPPSAVAWDLELRVDQGLGRLAPVDLTIHPHHLGAEVRRHAIESLRIASAPATAGEPSADAVAAVRGGHRTPASAAAATAPDGADQAAGPEAAAVEHPVINLLGPVEVVGARGELSEERHRGSMLEALAFMALHPHRQRYPLDQALWPHERVPDARRQQLISRARRWLGTNADGAPYVLLVNPDGYRLAESVRTDWQQFTDLAASPPTTTTADLQQALRLVRGQPFAGHNPRRYGWADDDSQEMIAAVVDVAHELAVRAQKDGDGMRARRAALKGLLVEPSSEMLWRDALGATWLTGDRPGLEAMTDRFLALAEELGGDLEPETNALLERLYARLPHLGPSSSGGSSDAL